MDAKTLQGTIVMPKQTLTAAAARYGRNQSIRFRHTLVMIAPETSAEGNLRLPPLARERSGVIHY